MTRVHRCVLCAGFLLVGLAAQAGLEQPEPDRASAAAAAAGRRSPWSWATGSGATSRSPPTSSSGPRRPSTSTGSTRAASSPGCGSRSGSTTREKGTNLRHTPEICLPSGGWTKIESQTKVLEVAAPDGKDVPDHPPGLRPR